MEQAKQDLSRKDSELLALRTKLDTLNNQFSDSKQHVDVLKESLTAKEQRAAILQTEVQYVILSLTLHMKISFHSLTHLCVCVCAGGCFTSASGRKGISALQKESADIRADGGEEHSAGRDQRPQRHAGCQRTQS